MKMFKLRNKHAKRQMPLPELVPLLKRALRIQWREFIHEIEDAEDSDEKRVKANLATVFMLERSYKIS